MIVLGLDIGGANLKAAILKIDESSYKLKVICRYFPIWKKGKNALRKELSDLLRYLGKSEAIIAATMTAELSDVYFSKEEGVRNITLSLTDVFRGYDVYILTVDCKLIAAENSLVEPLKIASANWVATGWFLSKRFTDCIVVDTGSTSTSIIPVIDGKIAAAGKNDLEKLIHGELVYTGALRTNLACISRKVPFKNSYITVASELFATSGDIHLLLGNISRREYTCDTADGRGTSKREVMARIARLICADLSMVSESDILKIAKFLYRKQVEHIAEGIKKVYGKFKKRKKKPLVVVTGLGRFLGKEAARSASLPEVVDLGDLYGEEIALATPAVGLAFMALEIA